jgi:NAD-dependent SIR2 family protein deacetylase
VEPIKDKLEPDEYRCAMCGGVFKKGQTDEEAMKECDDNFGKLNPEHLAVICDDCYQDVRPDIHKDEYDKYKSELN